MTKAAPPAAAPAIRPVDTPCFGVMTAATLEEGVEVAGVAPKCDAKEDGVGTDGVEEATEGEEVREVGVEGPEEVEEVEGDSVAVTL